MGGVLRRAAIALALVTGVVCWRVATLPSAGVGGGALAAGEVRMAYHVHSARSDGTGTPASIAAAARDAGIDVVILTDHADGTRIAEPPQRLDGVLLVDAAEISTWAGHYVALGAAPSPYPLGGTPASVVEDVARLGGFGVVAHPGSAKDSLKWRDWDVPFGGVEWLNADSEWRDQPLRLVEALVTYPWAAVPTITALLDRPVSELRAWDRRAARTPTVGIAAHDAHARVGLSGVGEPYEGTVALSVPGYASMFRAFSNVVRVGAGEWGRDAAADAASVMAAVRGGHLYSVITGRGAGRVVTFAATSGGTTATMGDQLSPAGGVTFVAETTAPSDATSTLVCDGRAVASADGPRLVWSTPSPPGACRLEVAVGLSPAAPWLVTNPIYVRSDLRLPDVQTLPVMQRREPLPRSDEPAAWIGETSPGSTASAEDDRSGGVRYRWSLGAQGAAPYAALRLDTPPSLSGADRLVMRAAADRPMRVWLQLRTPQGDGDRWGSSAYLDQTPRDVVIPFDRLLSIDRRSGTRVPIERVSALLLVIDTVHTRPGDAGVVRLESLSLAR